MVYCECLTVNFLITITSKRSFKDDSYFDEGNLKYTAFLFFFFVALCALCALSAFVRSCLLYFSFYTKARSTQRSMKSTIPGRLLNSNYKNSLQRHLVSMHWYLQAYFANPVYNNLWTCLV